MTKKEFEARIESYVLPYIESTVRNSIANEIGYPAEALVFGEGVVGMIEDTKEGLFEDKDEVSVDEIIKALDVIVMIWSEVMSGTHVYPPVKPELSEEMQWIFNARGVQLQAIIDKAKKVMMK